MVGTHHLGACNTAAYEGGVAPFEEQPLLRIHLGDFGGREGELGAVGELGALERGEEARRAQVHVGGLVDRPPLRWHLAHRVGG